MQAPRMRRKGVRNLFLLDRAGPAG
jgi:hypothetical protein